MPDPRDGADWTRGAGCLVFASAGLLLVYAFAAVFGLVLNQFLPLSEITEACSW